MAETASACLTLDPPTTPPARRPRFYLSRAVGRLQARRLRFSFRVQNPSRYGALELAAPAGWENWRLNNRPLPLPYPQCRYGVLPGIPPALLRSGENVLSCSVPPGAAGPTGEPTPGEPLLERGVAGESVRLLGRPWEEAPAFLFPPVVSAPSHEGVIVSCHTDRAAAVTLEAAGRRVTTPPGLHHAMRVGGLPPATAVEYILRARTPGGSEATAGPFMTRTLPAAGAVTLAACGDSQSNVAVWGAVARRIREARPDLLLHAGDFLSDGRLYPEWAPRVFRPAAPLLASVPTLAVPGNHEKGSGVFHAMFRAPGRGRHWEARVGPVAILGIDSEAEWGAGGLDHRWLVAALERSRSAPYLFALFHHPPYSSTVHGSLRAGRPRQRACRRMREAILPLLVRFRATGILAGHGHAYERAELPGGVTLIVTGGAGALPYEEAPEAAEQSPHREIYVPANHALLLRADESSCRAEALTPEGEVLDTRAWSPRPRD